MKPDDPLDVAQEQIQYMRARGLTLAHAADAIGLASPPLVRGWPALTWEYARLAAQMSAARRTAA